MAGVNDSDTIPAGPWPDGVNQVAQATAVPPSALRAAVNVDIDNAGWPHRRAGTTPRVTAARSHSLYDASGTLLANTDGDWCAYRRDPTGALSLEATLRAGIGPRYVSACDFDADIYWSNGLVLRRVDADLIDHPAALDTPRAPVLAASSNGGLAAGEYAVALTWRDANGRESGASPASVLTIESGQGLFLTDLPDTAAEDAVSLSIYASTANGDVLYHVATVAAGTPAFNIGAHAEGRALETEFLIPMPAGDIVRVFNGRLLVAAAAMLFWSEALRPGLMARKNHLRVGMGITLLEPVGQAEGAAGGLYVADHKTTYFFAGPDPATWTKTRRYPAAAVPGTSMTLPGDKLGFDTTAPVAVWLATDGVYVAGLPGGTVVPLTKDRLALPADSERGTIALREYGGIRQLITTFLTSDRNRFGVSDSAAATVRRNGVTTA